MNAREISIRVRDALLLLEQQESGQPETLIDELESEAAASLRLIKGLIEGMASQRNLWLVNGMREAIADPEAQIPGTFSRSRWAEIEEAFNGLEAWLATRLPGCGQTPLAVVYRRGNPPEPTSEPTGE
jgi:hypothetical protein